MASDEITLNLTRAEAEAVEEWSGMAGVGFHYGPKPIDKNDPSVTALAKLTKALGNPQISEISEKKCSV